MAPFSLMSRSLLAIEIPWDPNIVTIGGFLLTWHGLFTAVGILVGVQLALWLARQIDFDVDNAYTLALIGIPSGILGARVLFVAEHWDHYRDNLGDILAITEGGISVWGAVLGGVLFPLLYALWRRWDVWKGLDAASVGLIAGLAIGRIGDLVNGEHLSRATDLPWAVVYTDPDSPAFAHSLLVGGHHPATTYEMFALFAFLGVAIYLARGPWQSRPGLTFFLFLGVYAALRFVLSELRLDSAGTFIAGITVPQLVAIAVFILAVVPAAYILKRGPRGAASPSAARASRR